MKSFYLIRHGESHQDNLTPNGREQVRLAVERWSRQWDGKSAIGWHAPVRRTADSAAIFSANTGIRSIECTLMAIKHFHDHERHFGFTLLLRHEDAKHVILIGHDETRRICDAIVRENFGRTDKAPEVPQGGVLRFTKAKGYELI